MNGDMPCFGRDNALAWVKERGDDDRVCLRTAHKQMNVCIGKSASNAYLIACDLAVFVRSVSGERLEICYGEARKYSRVRPNVVVTFK
jgi:hypothetical protein